MVSVCGCALAGLILLLGSISIPFLLPNPLHTHKNTYCAEKRQTQFDQTQFDHLCKNSIWYGNMQKQPNRSELGCGKHIEPTT